MTRRTAIGGLIACLLAAGAHAQPRQSPPSGQALLPAGLFFAGMDRNHDYRIDATELTAGLDAAWTGADANGDAALSPFEFDAWRGAALGDRGALPGRVSIDRDMNNLITEDEFRSAFITLAARYGLTPEAGAPFSAFIRPLEQPPIPSQQRRPPSGAGRRGPPGGGRPPFFS